MEVRNITGETYTGLCGDQGYMNCHTGPYSLRKKFISHCQLSDRE